MPRGVYEKTPGHKAKLSISLRARYIKEKHPMYGTHRTKETKQRISASSVEKYRGENSPAWRGGAWRDGRGYINVYSPVHPGRDHHGYVYAHRLVAEKAICRHLKPTELVHHINENGSDNRNNNLLICSRSYHAWLHKTMNRKVAA